MLAETRWLCMTLSRLRKHAQWVHHLPQGTVKRISCIIPSQGHHDAALTSSLWTAIDIHVVTGLLRAVLTRSWERMDLTHWLQCPSKSMLQSVLSMPHRRLQIYVTYCIKGFDRMLAVQYERTNRVYNYNNDPCGITHITVGDGGNVEQLQTAYVDAAGQCPAAPTAAGTCATLQNGAYCPSVQPPWSAFRESAFGHGRLFIPIPL